MLSGQRAFKGDDMSDTLAAVLRQDIDWTALPASTPASVRRLIARCLDRDVRRRLRDIGEARIVLDDPAAPLDAADAARCACPRAAAAPVATRDSRRALRDRGRCAGWNAAWYLSLRPSTPLAVTRFPFTLPEGQAFTKLVARHMVALSPDGTQMVYAANTPAVSPVDVGTGRARRFQAPKAFRNVTDPVFSPDGRSIAFYAVADQTLKRIAVTGGAAVTICPADAPFGISWGPDGIVFGQGGKGIMRVSPNGGTPERARERQGR